MGIPELSQPLVIWKEEVSWMPNVWDREPMGALFPTEGRVAGLSGEQIGHVTPKWGCTGGLEKALPGVLKGEVGYWVGAWGSDRMQTPGKADQGQLGAAGPQSGQVMGSRRQAWSLRGGRLLN